MTRRDLFTKPDREQVPFNLSAPAITGKPFQAGQYSVAVQDPVPASQTSLGKLAATLGQINPAIKAYGQAQQATTDLQKTMFGLDFAQMTEKEKELAAQRLKSEEKFNSKLRGEGYELNPVAEIYAKELIGADKADEYMAFIEENKAQYIEDQVVIKGRKPSPMQINEFIEGLTTQFKEANQDTMSDPLMLAGFMRSTTDYRNRASVQIAKEASDSHKNGVLIPQAAKALSRVSTLSDMKVPTLDGKAASMSTQERNARYQEAWTKTGPLTAADQKLVLQSWLNSMKPGLAQVKLEELAESGIKVGNEPLRSYDPVGDSYYNNLQDELEDKEIEERKERITEDTLFKNEKAKEFDKLFDSEEYRDLSYAEKQEYQEKLEDEIKNITDGDEQALTSEAFRVSRQKEATARDRGVATIRKVAGRSGTDSLVSFQNQGLQELQKEADEFIKSNGIKEEDPAYGLIKGFVELEKGDLVTGGFDVGPPQSKTIEMIGKFKRDFNSFMTDLQERLFDAEGGESLSIGDKTYNISDERTLESKQNILDEALLSERTRLLEEIKTEFKSLITENKKELDERAAAIKEEGERPERITDLQTARKEDLKKLSLSKGRRRRDRPVEGYSDIFVGGSALSAIRTQPELMTQGKVSGSQILGNAYAANDVMTEIDSFTAGLANGAYQKRDAKILFEVVRSNYDKTKKYLKSDYDHFLTQYTSNLGFIAPSDAQRTNAKIQLDLAAKAILSSRRLAGYNTFEVLKSMEKGSIPEGVDITGETTDGVSFFENELLGENTDGRALTILNYENKEELQPIADKLGVSVDTIDEAQKRGLEYYQGETTPERVKKLQQTIEREDKPLRETIETKPERKAPFKVPTVPSLGDLKVDTKVSTIEGEDPSEPTDVKVGTRISTEEQLQLPLEQQGATNTLTIPKDSKIGKPIQNLKSSFEKAGAKYNVDPAFLMAIAIMETGHGKSSAFRTKRNAMGVTDGDIVRTFPKVEDSINHMAKTLANPNGPYKGLTTVDEIATKYSPVGADNDVNKTNAQWPKIVKKLMKQLNRGDVDNLTVVNRPPQIP
jgi:flagellum-specific peptidoglycan hydrolase FlgJ